MIHDNLQKEFRHAIETLDKADRTKGGGESYSHDILPLVSDLVDLVRAYSVMLLGKIEGR